MKEGESGESYLAIGPEELCSGGGDNKWYLRTKRCFLGQISWLSYVSQLMLERLRFQLCRSSPAWASRFLPIARGAKPESDG